MTETANIQNGIILKGIGGFYYVKTADAVLECRAKGIFRKRGITPAAGDNVSVVGSEEGFVISEIKPRKNSFDRPLVANVDTLFYVVSTVDPKPNVLVTDKLFAIACGKGVVPVLVTTKTDLGGDGGFSDIYRNSGFTVIDVREDPKEAYRRIKELAKGGISVFTGNSGVGKSTLLNDLFPELKLETGDISRKLGRGRHTTRAVELYEWSGGYMADTPGFSAVDLEHGEEIDPEELAFCFPEFREFTDGCYFSGCSHTVEKGCALLEALSDGKIQKSRHDSYRAMYTEAKERKKQNPR